MGVLTYVGTIVEKRDRAIVRSAGDRSERGGLPRPRPTPGEAACRGPTPRTVGEQFCRAEDDQISRALTRDIAAREAFALDS